ncbi:MAG: SinR family protein [Candidatus Pacebacteria bacterium]|nr:SinR family protein [Candidatus Paceibacterota bacterium]
MVYQINYDLRKPGRNYDELFEKIQEVSYDNINPLKSTWFIASNSDASTVRDELMSVIDYSDALIVNVAKAPSAWFGLSDDSTRWLQNYLK